MHGLSSSGVLLCGRGPLADTSTISRLGAASDNGTMNRCRDTARFRTARTTDQHGDVL